MEDWTSIMSLIVFTVLVISEAIISSKRQMELYDGKDTVANIVLGILTFFTKVGTKAGIYAVYLYLYQFVDWKLPETVLFFVIGLLINDLFFYWYHRISHTTRFFWAMHVAHHSSEKMNVTIAIRGNFVNNIFHAILWIPMLFLGFSPFIVITTDAFSYFYQLWLHTRIIPKLGPIEWIFNTPSHHRVHHGSNPRYLDKNYAAVFIFWDKMFGTYEEETEEVRYGLTKPFQTNNPLKIAFYEFGAVYRDTVSKKTWRERWRELWRKP
jgi:sterol desaturase/sphingolipid hydroxylase (fatty acid hydroxylase superfamily)